MNPIKNYFKFLLLTFVIVAVSCDKDEDDTPTYDIPTTYSFKNVSYSGQTQRLSMLHELKTYMNTANTSGVALDAERMKAMYANDDPDITSIWNNAYDPSKQLKNKTFDLVQSDFEDLMDKMAAASQSTTAGSEGVSGVIESADGAKKYLIGDDGLEYTQLIEKGLMGACFYHQAMAVYFSDDRMNVDNEVVTEGEGTKMEHHWDEAFGYLGVQIDFPTNTDGLFFWGNYCNGRDALLNTNSMLMNALLKGRAAISNGDLATRDEAIAEARDAWELVSVGTALHYLNGGIENFDDMALRSHNLSEAIAFIYSLQFNPTKKMDNTALANLLNLVAGSSDFASINLYNASVANLQQAKDDLAAAYGLEDKKDDL